MRLMRRSQEVCSGLDVSVIIPLQDVRDWYEETFGFSVTDLGSGTLSLENDAVHWFLTEDPSVSAEHVERQHVSFEVEALAPVIERLRAEGVRHETGTYRGFRHRNYRWCEWRDPAGIRVECVETLEEG